MSIQNEIRKYLLSFVTENQTGQQLRELIGAISRYGSVLLAQTYALFYEETRENMRLLTKDTIIILLGGACLWIGLLTFVTALIIVLSFFIPLWLAVVCVSLFFSLLGLVLVISGIAMFKRRSITPQLTIQAIRDNAQWIKEHLEQTPSNT